MFSLKITTQSSTLEKLNKIIDAKEITNVSIFENPELGFSSKLDENGFPIANYFNVEIFFQEEQEAIEFCSELKKVFQEAIKGISVAKLEDEDWVKLYTQELQPVICGKFYIYNELTQDFPDSEKLIPIKLNSALAFGSGHHQTTKCCVLNSILLEETGFKPKNILDMGCGTGILGICALKIWEGAKLLGIDIDKDAVRITAENYKANNVRAKAIVDSDLASLFGNKFELILCNILKQPLIDLCSGFYKILNSGGNIIVSGFITNQEDEIRNCYTKEGFIETNRICIEDWLSILFSKS